MASLPLLPWSKLPRPSLGPLLHLWYQPSSAPLPPPAADYPPGARAHFAFPCFLFWNNFKQLEKLQEENKELLCHHHSHSPMVNDWPCLPESSLSLSLRSHHVPASHLQWIPSEDGAKSALSFFWQHPDLVRPQPPLPILCFCLSLSRLWRCVILLRPSQALCWLFRLCSTFFLLLITWVLFSASSPPRSFFPPSFY